MGTVMAQRMNVQTAQLTLMSTSNAGSPGGAGDLQQLVQNPNAFLQPATRELLSPDVVALFQSMLANALHTTFVIGTVVSVLALLSVAVIPPVQLDRSDPPR